jgi:cytochrome c-type biogenesis protein CcmH
MIEYIVSLLVLMALALTIIFWPIKFTSSKGLALLLALISLGALLAVNFNRNQTQQALSGYIQEKAYQKIVQDFLSGQKANIENAENLDALSFLRSLQRHLQLNTHDTNAWFILGNALQGVDNNQHSLMAYQRAYRVNRDDEATILAYVNARLSTLGEQEQADVESITLLKGVLEKNPEQENALMLLGVAAYQGQEFQLAIEAWNNLLSAFQQRSLAENKPIPDQVVAALQSSIDKAKEKAKAKAEQKNHETVTDASEFNIVINVSINELAAKDLGTRAGENPVLFVYARKPQQKGMPLAAIKYNLAEGEHFPRSLILSNQNSLAGIDLSQFKSIELSARISFSGQAIPQPGDWQSDTLLVKNESFKNPQNLEIYRRIEDAR